MNCKKNGNLGFHSLGYIAQLNPHQTLCLQIPGSFPPKKLGLQEFLKVRISISSKWLRPSIIVILGNIDQVLQNLELIWAKFSIKHEELRIGLQTSSLVCFCTVAGLSHYCKTGKSYVGFGMTGQMVSTEVVKVHSGQSEGK